MEFLKFKAYNVGVWFIVDGLFWKQGFSNLGSVTSGCGLLWIVLFFFFCDIEVVVINIMLSKINFSQSTTLSQLFRTWTTDMGPVDLSPLSHKFWIFRANSDKFDFATFHIFPLPVDEMPDESSYTPTLVLSWLVLLRIRPAIFINHFGTSFVF